LAAFQDVASFGTTIVVPFFRPTRPSVIWSITRSDSPSETTAPSSEVGSEAVPNTSVSLVAPVRVVAASVTAVTVSATATAASSTFSPLPIVLLCPRLPLTPGRARPPHSMTAKQQKGCSVAPLVRDGRNPDVGRRLRGQRGELAERGESAQRLSLELPHALARQVQLVADRLERPRLALEAEPQLEDPPLALGKGIERAPDTLAAERLPGCVERVDCLTVGEEVAELSLVVCADRLVQRDGRVGGAHGLLDVLERQSGRLGQLLLRRLASELDLEPPRGAGELLLALDDVHRDADRARVVCHGALHRLPDPPGRVGRELEAAPPVELLD